MELHHIRAFVTLADESNVTRAAARLHLSQPNLTRKLKSLEAELGCALFQRTSRGLVLTRLGHVFLKEARVVLSASANAVEMARRFVRQESGQLRVGYLMGLPKIEVIMAGFQRTNPQAQVTLVEMTPAEQVRRLENREIDIGFIGLPYALKETKLSGHCVARYENVAAVPEASALARKKRLRFSDLQDQVYLGVNIAEYPHWDQWAKEAAKRGFRYRQAKEGPGQISALLDQVAANLGITLFPEHSIKHEGVVFRHVIPPLLSDLYVAWNPANMMPLVHEFLRTVGAEKHHYRATPRRG